jgi:hypothetical protein
MKLTELAKVLGLHRNTLRRRLKEAGMSREFSTITNANLDELLRAYKQRRPESGLRYAIGYLRTRGLKVQHKRVMMSLKRIDGLGRILRHRQVTQRRTYTAKRPNAIWHVDGHHKLIRWGIVIHGFIDGYCQITALHASSNNRAITVLELLLHGIDEFGHPSRLRGDRGSENVYIAVYMIIKKGPKRVSFIWGP